MQDTFWTPELLCEFFNSSPDLPPTLMNEINLFKSSKSPKKEWEIVAYKFRPLSEEKPVLVTPNSQYWEFAQSGDPEYIIHSVRRLSDGEIFSVGDRINGGIIQKIDTTTSSMDGIMFRTANVSKPISCAEKLPQPILTTVDGVDKFEGENYWYVNSDWTISNYNISTEWVKYPKEDKYFSTEQAAQKWIAENKPLLSLNDVKKVFGEHEVYLLPTELEEKLTTLVKQKLNQ